MNPFQIFLLGALSILLTVTLVAVARKRLSRREGSLLTLLWIAGALVVVWPDATTRLANTLGIGRGANLLLYLACIGMAVGFLWTYVRFKQVNRDITLLSRHLAIREAHRESDPEERPPDPE